MDILTMALARKYAATLIADVAGSSSALQPSDLRAHNESNEAHPNLRELIQALQDSLNALEQGVHTHNNADILNSITQTPASLAALNALSSRITELEQLVNEALIPPILND